MKMDNSLKEELKEIKRLRGNLKKDGYNLVIPWNRVKKAIIYNWKQQNYYK